MLPDGSVVDLHPESTCSRLQRAQRFIKRIHQSPLSASGGRAGVLHGYRRLAHPGRPENKGTGAALDAPSKQSVQRRQSAGEVLLGEFILMLAGNDARVNHDALTAHRVIVVTL